MNLLSRLSKYKQTIQTVLLFIQIFSPILMFVGVRSQASFLIISGLVLLVLANLTATLTK